MADASAVFLPEIVARIAAFLPQNDVTCNVRLVCRATAEQFRERPAVTLSQPVPHAVFAAHWSAPEASRGLSLAQRRKLVCLTAASGDLTNLELALAASGCAGERLGMEACTVAGAAGKLEPCRWFLEQGLARARRHAPNQHPSPDHPHQPHHPSPDQPHHPVTGLGRLDFMCKVARAGQREVCEWALGVGVRWSEHGPQCAAEGGHTDLLEWLLSARPAGAPQPHWSRILAGAAASCDLTKLERLWAEHGGKVGSYDRSKCLCAALGSPTHDWQAKAEFLEGQGCALQGWTELPLLLEDSAAARLAWLSSRHGRLHPSDAVALGDLAQVRQLLSSEGPGSAANLGRSRAVERAAAKGHLEALKLVAAQCRIDAAACALSAAGGGQLEVLEWLLETFRAEGMGGWRPELASEAAHSARVELMQWMREHGCLFGADAWLQAADSGCEAALELLAAWDTPHPADGQPYSIAAQNGDLRSLRVLRRLGLGFHSSATFSDAVWQAGRGGGAPLEALQWLHAEGCPVDWEDAQSRVTIRTVFDEQPVREWIDAHVNELHLGHVNQVLALEASSLQQALQALQVPARPVGYRGAARVSGRHAGAEGASGDG